MSYPTASEVRTLLRATQPGTVLWEGRLEQTEDADLALFGPPAYRQVVVDRRGALAVRVEYAADGPSRHWYTQARRFNRSIVQFALSRHGLCAPPVGWEEVVL